MDTLMLLGVLMQAIWLIPAALQLAIGIYVNKNYKSDASSLVFIGSIICIIMALSNILVNNLIIRQIGFGDNMQLFFYGKSFLHFVGQVMFLYGVLQLFKNVKQGRFSADEFNPKASNPFFME